MNLPSFALGIDAGGTSLRAALVPVGTSAALDLSGTRWVPAAPDGGPDLLASLIPDLLTCADIRADSVCAACAGIAKITRGDTKGRWERVLSDLLPRAQVRIVPDYEIAFHGAIAGGVGLAIIAGTGSVAYGENGQGGVTRVGGRGWEFGDEGSGAWLTTEMVRRTLRALDGMETPSPLTQAVCDLLHTDDPAQVGERARQQTADQGRGFLVPLLLERAQSSDLDATNLFVGAGGWLAALARAGLQQLGLTPGDAPVVTTVGGLWQAGDLLVGPFARVLHRWYPHAEVRVSDAPPIVGAVRLARQCDAASKAVGN